MLGKHDPPWGNTYTRQRNRWCQCFLGGPCWSYRRRTEGTGGGQQVSLSREAVTNSGQTPTLIEEEAPFLNMLKFWKEQKYGHGSWNQEWLCWQEPAEIYPFRPGMLLLLVTALARTSSNLPEMTWRDVTRPGMLGKERVGAWPPALRQKYMSCIPWDPEPRMTVLVRASSEYPNDQQEWWMVSYVTPRVVTWKNMATSTMGPGPMNKWGGGQQQLIPLKDRNAVDGYQSPATVHVCSKGNPHCWKILPSNK
jgi:hypothetical protein